MYVLYSVSLCCFVYCLCVNVYLREQLLPGLNPIAVKNYINTSISFLQNTTHIFIYVLLLPEEQNVISAKLANNHDVSKIGELSVRKYY